MSSETGGGRAEPGVVYHYTSHAAALGIVRSSELWLTNICYLNDGNEFWWVFKNFEAYAEDRDAKKDPLHSLLVTRVRRASTRGERTISICVACLSERPDDAAQWQRYADSGRGVAVGFRRAALEAAVTPRDGAGRSVVYGVAACLAAIDAGARKGEERMAKDGHHANIGDEVIRVGVFSKEPSFETEHEYRIARFGCGFNEYEYRPRADSLVPYVKLPIPHDAISEIRVGPQAADESEQAWRQLLVQMNNGRTPDGMFVTRSKSGLR